MSPPGRGRTGDRKGKAGDLSRPKLFASTWGTPQGEWQKQEKEKQGGGREGERREKKKEARALIGLDGLGLVPARKGHKKRKREMTGEKKRIPDRDIFATTFQVVLFT